MYAPQGNRVLTGRRAGHEPSGGGRIPLEYCLEDAVGGLGKEAADDFMGFGKVVRGAAALEVFVEVHEGGEAEAVVSDAPDEGKGPRLR